MSKNDKIKKFIWGTEVTWASNEKYCAKFLIFDNKHNKTDFIYHKDVKKTWFVNSGEFIVRYINPKDGKFYHNELKEGSTWEVFPLVPTSLECLTENGSISEASTEQNEEDLFFIAAEGLF